MPFLGISEGEIDETIRRPGHSLKFPDTVDFNAQGGVVAPFMSEKLSDLTPIRGEGAAEPSPLRRVDGQLVIVALTPAVARLVQVARTIARERKTDGEVGPGAAPRSDDGSSASARAIGP
jgi:hypothetical protein